MSNQGLVWWKGWYNLPLIIKIDKSAKTLKWRFHSKVGWLISSFLNYKMGSLLFDCKRSPLQSCLCGIGYEMEFDVLRCQILKDISWYCVPKILPLNMRYNNATPLTPWPMQADIQWDRGRRFVEKSIEIHVDCWAMQNKQIFHNL